MNRLQCRLAAPWKKWRQLARIVTAVGLATAAVAPVAGATANEREQITRERAQVLEQHLAHEARCTAQFDVNACLARAQRNKQAALKPLDARMAALQAQERASRTQESQARVAQRQERAASRPGPVPQAHAPRGAASPTPSAAGLPQLKVSQARRAEEAAKAAKRAKAQEQRRLGLENRNKAVQERNAQRAKGRSPAAPLPVPASAAGA